MSRVVGTGCLALAAIYTVSLAFWWPRAAELAAIAGSASGLWLLRLLALKLLLDALLVVPTALVGLKYLLVGEHRPLGLWIIGAGLVANSAPFLSYLAAAMPLYVTQGGWLRFGPHNDFGIVSAVATLTFQVMLLSVLLRRRSSTATAILATSH